MLVNFDKSGRLIWFNSEIGKEDATSYLSENTVWVDSDMPVTESKDGYNAAFYINDDMQSIRVEYEPIPEPEPTMEEKIYTAVSKSQDELRQEGADMVMEEMKKRGLIV